ncbi:hypothetical protein BJ878DRAFT_522769 [Calycina marina]|uniref:O-acetylhomoserine (Thiol)-lyase n=1 Tax=Calycina marina TaxID=1763456 RepID=A0A9P7YWM6_9HELO|nr:hypothetical protein BJ878DRAFT_522769 [Calycina marina]
MCLLGQTNGFANEPVQNGRSKMEKRRHQWRFDTLQIHAGLEENPVHGHITLPIYNTASFKFDKLSDMNNALENMSTPTNQYLYSRLSNPTNDGVEKRIAALEDGVNGLVYSSGTASVYAIIVSLAGMGDNVIVSTGLHGGTFKQFRKAGAQLGIEANFCDTNDLERVRQLINDRTKFIFVESLANPKLSVPDYDALIAIAHSPDLRIPLVVDATFTACGYFCQPAHYGADIIVHSASKWIAGHGTTIAGAVVETGRSDWQSNRARFPRLHGEDPDLKKFDVGQDNWYETAGDKAFIRYLKNDVLRDTGSCLSPYASQQLFISLETLSVRCERQAKTTDRIARWLSSHPRVAWVGYLGFEDHPYHHMALKYLQRGFGTVITLGLVGGGEMAEKIIDAFKLIITTTNVGDSKTLCNHHWSGVNKHYSKEENEKMGITEDLIRLSLGLEDVQDIIWDFEQAFDQVQL